MNNMNKYLTFLIGCVTILACDKTVEPQMLFENIPSYCQISKCNKNSDSYKSLRSDTLLLINVKGILDNGKFLSVRDLNGNVIDTKRFPYYDSFAGTLHVSNIPEILKVREASKYWEVEMDFVLYYFIVPTGYDYSGYPADLVRIKLVKQLKL
jgi:hypothetical protein